MKSTVLGNAQLSLNTPSAYNAKWLKREMNPAPLPFNYADEIAINYTMGSQEITVAFPPSPLQVGAFLFSRLHTLNIGTYLTQISPTILMADAALATALIADSIFFNPLLPWGTTVAFFLDLAKAPVTVPVASMTAEDYVEADYPGAPFANPAITLDDPIMDAAGNVAMIGPAVDFVATADGNGNTIYGVVYLTPDTGDVLAYDPLIDAQGRPAPIVIDGAGTGFSYLPRVYAPRSPWRGVP